MRAQALILVTGISLGGCGPSVSSEVEAPKSGAQRAISEESSAELRLPSEEDLVTKVQEFIAAFNARNAEAMKNLSVPSDEVVWVSNYAGSYSQSGVLGEKFKLFSDDGPMMYQAKMRLPEATRGPYEHWACAGKARFGVRDFTPNELGRWVEGEGPNQVNRLAEATRAYLYFPLHRLLVLWGVQEAGWHVVGVRALDWCESTPVADLIGEPTSLPMAEANATASGSVKTPTKVEVEVDSIRTYLRSFAALYNEHDFKGLDSLGGDPRSVILMNNWNGLRQGAGIQSSLEVLFSWVVDNRFGGWEPMDVGRLRWGERLNKSCPANLVEPRFLFRIHSGELDTGPWESGISYASAQAKESAFALIAQTTHYVTDDGSGLEMFLKSEGQGKWRVLVVNYIRPEC